MVNVPDELRQRLANLAPYQLDIVDESHQHAGHAGVKGLPSEHTHFLVRIGFHHPSGQLSRLDIHRLVYAAVGDLIPHPIHALRMEWISR